MEDKLEEILEAISNAAPEIWAAALRQAQIDAVIYVIIFAVVILVLAGAVFAAIKMIRSDNTITEGALMIVVAVVIALIATSPLRNAITAIYNPQFYALRLLLKAITEQ